MHRTASHDKALPSSLRKSAVDRFLNLEVSSKVVIPKGFPLKENLTIVTSKTLWTQFPIWLDDPSPSQYIFVAVLADLPTPDHKPLLHIQNKLRSSSLCTLLYCC